MIASKAVGRVTARTKSAWNSGASFSGLKYWKSGFWKLRKKIEKYFEKILPNICRVYHRSSDRHEPLKRHQSTVTGRQRAQQRPRRRPFLFQFFRRFCHLAGTKTSPYPILKVEKLEKFFKIFFPNFLKSYRQVFDHLDLPIFQAHLPKVAKSGTWTVFQLDPPK